MAFLCTKKFDLFTDRMPAGHPDARRAYTDILIRPASASSDFAGFLSAAATRCIKLGEIWHGLRTPPSDKKFGVFHFFYFLSVPFVSGQSALMHFNK